MKTGGRKRLGGSSPSVGVQIKTQEENDMCFWKKKKEKEQLETADELVMKLITLKKTYESLIEQLKEKNKAADEILRRLKKVEVD